MTPPTISQMMFGVALVVALVGMGLIVWSPGLWFAFGCYLQPCAAMGAVIAWFLRGDG